jgi:hypothetical protein
VVFPQQTISNRQLAMQKIKKPEREGRALWGEFPGAAMTREIFPGSLHYALETLLVWNFGGAQVGMTWLRAVVFLHSVVPCGDLDLFASFPPLKRRAIFSRPAKRDLGGYGI